MGWSSLFWWVTFLFESRWRPCESLETSGRKTIGLLHLWNGPIWWWQCNGMGRNFFKLPNPATHFPCKCKHPGIPECPADVCSPLFSSTPRDAHIPAGQRSPSCGSRQHSVSTPAPFECVALASILAGHVSHRAYLGWIGQKSAFQMWHTHSPATWTSSCSRVGCFATTLPKRKDKINAQTMPSMYNCKGRTYPLLTWNWKVGGPFFCVTLRSYNHDLEKIKHNKSFDMHWMIFVPIFVRKYIKISEI